MNWDANEILCLYGRNERQGERGCRPSKRRVSIHSSRMVRVCVWWEETLQARPNLPYYTERKGRNREIKKPGENRCKVALKSSQE